MRKNTFCKADKDIIASAILSVIEITDIIEKTLNRI